MVTNQEEDQRGRQPFTLLSGQYGGSLTPSLPRVTAAAAAILAFCQERPHREGERADFRAGERLRLPPQSVFCPVKSDLTPLGFKSIVVGSRSPHRH